MVFQPQVKIPQRSAQAVYDLLFHFRLGIADQAQLELQGLHLRQLA